MPYRIGARRSSPVVPAVTCMVVAYAYLVSPLVVPVLTPLARLVPARVKEALS